MRGIKDKILHLKLSFAKLFVWMEWHEVWIYKGMKTVVKMHIKMNMYLEMIKVFLRWQMRRFFGLNALDSKFNGSQIEQQYNGVNKIKALDKCNVVLVV